MSGKIHPKKPVAHAVGPTYTANDAAKFPNKGKEHGKTDSDKTVISQKEGPTFTCNDPAFSFPEASEYGVGKSMGQKSKPAFDPHSRKPVNIADNPVVTTPTYALKKSYEK